jgi:C4-dicarboxylate-specific signal transduction histidine kinase
VFLGFRGSNRDITNQKKVEREVREQRDALARVERIANLGQLTGSIAHELNQPLSGILSNAQAGELLLRDGKIDPAEMAAIITEIVADTKRAGEIIRNLRDLYREQKGDFQAVDLNALVEETLRILRSEFVMQNVTLTTKYTDAIPEVMGNRIQLQQVLVNLIMNAQQAMSDMADGDRTLHIATEHGTAGEALVSVEDRGSGIDPENIEKIFEPLATWNPGGTGMGLAISRTIIEAHGGRIRAENKPEGGARVSFALPAMEAQ